MDYEFNVVCEEGAAFGAGIGDNIVSMANDVDATAVVVSSHRKSMLAEFMMGSISNFLVHQCEKPVIVLHAPRLEVLLVLCCVSPGHQQWLTVTSASMASALVRLHHTLPWTHTASSGHFFNSCAYLLPNS